MKRKLLTFLMSLIMVAPLAGCGERDMSSNPKENEAKIVLRFAEIKPGTANEIVENQSELQYHYSDCAELSGEGFYTTGDVAHIEINYNNKACAFSGWVIDGLKRGSSRNLTLGINSGNAGKTINVYALMGKNGNAPQLDNSTLTIRMNSISVTSFDGQVYKLNQGKVVIPTSVIYEYDSTIEGFKNGSTNYTISDGKVTINEIEYQVNYDLTDPEKVVGLKTIDSDNKVYSLDANNKVTVVEDYEYEYDSSVGSNGGFKRGSNTYSITTNDVAQLENVAYSVLKDGNTITGLTELGNNVGETTTALQPADLETYKLPAAPGEEVISFAQMINRLQETTYQQGITLASLFPGTNLSYYTIPVDGEDTLQHYKITWKAAEGSCGGAATVIDPATFQFRNGVANYCLSAHIDMRAGLTDTYIESAIKSTLLNQMYVYENANSTCANAIKGNVTVNNECMFVRNIALLGDVIYQTTSEATAKGYKLFYYGVAEGNNGELRLESVEHDLEGLFYKSQTTQGSSSWKNPIKTSYVIANREEYALKIEEVYDALKHYYQNPRDAVGKVSFGLSRFTNEVVIDSMEYDGKTYYFNYVDDGSAMAYYYADNKITQTAGIKTGVIHKLTPFVTETENLTSDQTLLNQLEAKIRKNPLNLRETNGREW